MSLIDDFPGEAVPVVLALTGAIVRVVEAYRSGDRAAREEALMRAAEEIKAEHDRLKFGG